MFTILSVITLVIVALVIVGRVNTARVDARITSLVVYEAGRKASQARFEKEVIRRNHALWEAKQDRLASKKALLEALAKGAGYSEAFRGHPDDLVSLQCSGYKSWILRSELRDQITTMIEEDLLK